MLSRMVYKLFKRGKDWKWHYFQCLSHWHLVRWSRWISIKTVVNQRIDQLEGNGPMDERATRAKRNKFVMLYFWIVPYQPFKWPLRTSGAFKGLDGLKFQIWPQNQNQEPQLMVSMCMLPLTAILMASEAVTASKWPWRSKLTSMTYDGMLLWPVKASLRWFTRRNGPILIHWLRNSLIASSKFRLFLGFPHCPHKTEELGERSVDFYRAQDNGWYVIGRTLSLFLITCYAYRARLKGGQ